GVSRLHFAAGGVALVPLPAASRSLSFLVSVFLLAASTSLVTRARLLRASVNRPELICQRVKCRWMLSRSRSFRASLNAVCQAASASLVSLSCAFWLASGLSDLSGLIP